MKFPESSRIFQIKKYSNNKEKTMQLLKFQKI